MIHQASEDGYDLDRALQKFSDGRTPCVVVVEACGEVFGCFLGRVPTVNGRRRIDVGLFCGERAFPLVARPDAGFINCKRTQNYLAIGLDAATGGAALRLDADLAGGWSTRAAGSGAAVGTPLWTT